MALNKMSRKRCGKLLMAEGFSRNQVNRIFKTLIETRRLYELEQHRNKLAGKRPLRTGGLTFNPIGGSK